MTDQPKKTVKSFHDFACSDDFVCCRRWLILLWFLMLILHGSRISLITALSFPAFVSKTVNLTATTP